MKCLENAQGLLGALSGPQLNPLPYRTTPPPPLKMSAYGPRPTVCSDIKTTHHTIRPKIIQIEVMRRIETTHPPRRIIGLKHEYSIGVT